VSSLLEGQRRGQYDQKAQEVGSGHGLSEKLQESGGKLEAYHTPTFLIGKPKTNAGRQGRWPMGENSTESACSFKNRFDVGRDAKHPLLKNQKETTLLKGNHGNETRGGVISHAKMFDCMRRGAINETPYDR